MKALITLLEAGVPAEKLNTRSSRSAMEAAFKVSLTSPSHLLELVPVVQELQKKELSEEYSGIFDGTTEVAEVFVIARSSVDQRSCTTPLDCCPLSQPIFDRARTSWSRYVLCERLHFPVSAPS